MEVLVQCLHWRRYSDMRSLRLCVWVWVAHKAKIFCKISIKNISWLIGQAEHQASNHTVMTKIISDIVFMSISSIHIFGGVSSQARKSPPRNTGRHAYIYFGLQVHLCNGLYFNMAPFTHDSWPLYQNIWIYKKNIPQL